MDKKKKREFDRISGTGKGKEVPKKGAGGKYTWDGTRDLISEAYEIDVKRREPGDIKKDFY